MKSLLLLGMLASVAWGQVAYRAPRPRDLTDNNGKVIQKAPPGMSTVPGYVMAAAGEIHCRVIRTSGPEGVVLLCVRVPMGDPTDPEVTIVSAGRSLPAFIPLKPGDAHTRTESYQNNGKITSVTITVKKDAQGNISASADIVVDGVKGKSDCPSSGEGCML